MEMTSDNSIEIKVDFCLFNLLKDKCSICIPDYQRDYAQGRVDNGKIDNIRELFVKDLCQSLNDDTKICHLGLVYGSLSESGEGFVAVDGQQRLTTVFLLHAYLFLRAGIKDERYEALKQFNWNSRAYADEFVSFLLESDLAALNEDTDLSAYIRSLPFFFYDWETDPSVSAMMIMLAEIHKTFGKFDKEKCDEFCNILCGDQCRIIFDMLPLKKGSDEMVYLKMNSRGRELTTYENFKTKFQDEILHGNDDICKKMDGTWLDFIEKVASSKNEGEFMDPDVCYMNYINEFVYVEICRSQMEKDKSELYRKWIADSKISRKKTNNDVLFIRSEMYNEVFVKEATENFYKFTDWLAQNKEIIDTSFNESSYNDGDLEYFLKNLTGTAEEVTFRHRLLFASLVRFAELSNYREPDLESLKAWIRIWHNLNSASSIGNDNIENAVKRIFMAESIVPSEFIKMECSPFDKIQWGEERVKLQVLSDDEYASAIYCWEKKQRFAGSIRLLHFYPDEEPLEYDDFKKITTWFECLFDNYYSKNDYDFWKCMVTFVKYPDAHPNSYCRPYNYRLTQSVDNTRGNEVTHWFHDLLYDLKNYEVSDESWNQYVNTHTKTWMNLYGNFSYKKRRDLCWIVPFITDEERVRCVYEGSETKKLNNYDYGRNWNTVWLYHKKNHTSKSYLLSNCRDEIIRRIEPEIKDTNKWHVRIQRKNIIIQFSPTDIQYYAIKPDNEMIKLDGFGFVAPGFYYEEEGEDHEKYVSKMVETILQKMNDASNKASTLYSESEKASDDNSFQNNR